METIVSYSGSERERGSVHFFRKPIASLVSLGSLSVLAGCGRAPSFNILGSYFPAWLICMVVGIVLATVVYWVLTRFRLDKEIPWTILVYPCLAAFFAFTLWLVFFS
jgi:YtcA family